MSNDNKRDIVKTALICYSFRR